MKILVIHHCDSWGGAGVSLSLFCEMLMQNHEITVLLGHSDTEVTRELGKLPIKIKTIGADMAMISAYNGGPKFITRTFFKNLLKIPECNKRLKKHLEEEKYDLLVINSMTIAWICRLACKMKLPSIVYVRETVPHNHPGFSLIRYYIERYSDGQIYISEYDKKTMDYRQLKNKVGRSHWMVLRNSIHFDKFVETGATGEVFRKYEIKRGKLKILFVGGNDPLKGYDVLVEAIEKIDENNIQLIVAGNMPAEKQRDGVIYVGKVSNMSPFYKMSDVLVFPSIAGHQARPAFEAGAFHIPVIISDFPQTSEEVVNGVNGLTFQPKNSSKLSECIAYMFNHPEERKRMGENNYTRAKNYHDFEANKKSLLSFLTQFAVQ